MRSLLRHLLSILLLPFIMVVVVPYWLRQAYPVDAAGASLLLRVAGVALLAGGFLLFARCVRLFARVGQGTLAPWDPTHNLVALGPYRYMRNPMIAGVALMLLGQALVGATWALAALAGVFFLINHLYFVLSEEPGLEERFGEAYRIYKANVPRWLPRWRPWTGP